MEICCCDILRLVGNRRAFCDGDGGRDQHASERGTYRKRTRCRHWHLQNNSDQFRAPAQMSTWSTTIVTNCARMQLRRRPRQVQLSLDEKFGDEEKYSLSERLADFGPSTQDECERPELHGHMLGFVTQLSPSPFHVPLPTYVPFHSCSGHPTQVERCVSGA